MRGQKQRKAEIKRMVLGKTDGVCARCGKVVPFEKVTIEHNEPEKEYIEYYDAEKKNKKKYKKRRCSKNIL